MNYTHNMNVEGQSDFVTVFETFTLNILFFLMAGDNQRQGALPPPTVTKQEQEYLHKIHLYVFSSQYQ